MLKLPTSTIQLGHYEPGHGTKGKKRYITIEEMKKLHERKVSIAVVLQSIYCTTS